ncbi:M48 family metallopeptidase [Massilia sp. W12]|uniref:M48 family metallopeptidase n=1 Tax=Massilia sp. W12 TaxID=3126507 RepID=UPI0030D19761
MKTKLLLSSAALMLAMHAPAMAQNQASASQEDGVKVGGMSGMRNLVPAEELEKMAAQQYLSMKQQAETKKALAPDNHPQVKRLRTIADKLIPYASKWNPRAPQWKWEVNLIGSKQINAFCMPGGKIAFYTGILDQLQLTDDEVALVMGHEIAHALREHGRERMAKTKVTGALAGLAAGILSYKGVNPQVADGLTHGVANLTLLKFSRDNETDADVVGLDIAARAGYDPRAGVTLWQKMGAASKGAPPQWLSTHPAGTDRIAEIKKRLPEVMPLYAQTKGKNVASLPPFKTNTNLPPVQ